jgi:DNA-directed RNA polymerase specialized sigma24 family protein
LLPVLYVWAELRIPESARPLLEPGMLVAEVWRQARAQWPKANVEMRGWLLEIQRATFTEVFNVIRREVLFRGGAPGSIKVEKLLELSHADLSAIQQWRRQQGAASLLRQIELLTPVERRVLLHRGLEQLPDAEAGALSQLTSEEVATRWQNLKERFARWSELLSETEAGAGD